MNWQLLLAFASPVATLILAVSSVFWGRLVIEQRDAVIQAKDAALKAKEEQIETFKLWEPANMREQVTALHDLYRDQLETMKKQGEAQLAAAKELGDAQLAEFDEKAQEVARRHKWLVDELVDYFEKHEGWEVAGAKSEDPTPPPREN